MVQYEIQHIIHLPVNMESLGILHIIHEELINQDTSRNSIAHAVMTILG